MNLQELQLQESCFSSSSSSVCSPIIRVTAVDVIPAAPQRLLSSDYKPQTCAVDGCDLPVYKPGNIPPSARADLCISSCICLHGSTISDHHLIVSSADHDTDPCSTPLQVSFTESRTRSGSTNYCTNNFHRSTSEPQEDEWCGTWTPTGLFIYLFEESLTNDSLQLWDVETCTI